MVFIFIFIAIWSLYRESFSWKKRRFYWKFQIFFQTLWTKIKKGVVDADCRLQLTVSFWCYSVVVVPSAPLVLEGSPADVSKREDGKICGETPAVMFLSSGGTSVMVNIKGTKGFFKQSFHASLVPFCYDTAHYDTGSATIPAHYS